MQENLSIDGLNLRGQGMTRDAGNRSLFVDGALPGELVQAEVLHDGPTHTRLKATNILRAHRGRITPACPVAATCGGCNLQHLAYDCHAEIKHDLVVQAFEKVGVHVPEFSVHMASHNTAWRVRTTLAVPERGLRALPGLYAADSHSIVGTDTCAVDHPALNAVREQLVSHTDLQDLPGWKAATQTGLRHVLLRTTADGAATYVALVGRKLDTRSMQAALEACQAVPGVVGCAWLEQAPDTNAVLRGRTRLTRGTDSLQETVLGHTFMLPALGFIQQHRKQTESLYQSVLDATNSAEAPITELFAGSGILACLLARQGHRVDAFESAPDALTFAARNLNDHACNGRVTLHDVNLYQANMHPVTTGDRVVLADPPRKGLGAGLLQRLTTDHARELHYISCNPDSAARDVLHLVQSGYKLAGFSAWDMFPWTTHTELYICLKT